MAGCSSPDQATGQDPAGGDAATAGGSSVGEADAATRSTEPARDIVLVTLDTLRYDALAFLGDEDRRFATEVPNLEKLAGEGRSFSFALAHNTITLPSHANILTGRYPFEHGVRENAAYELPDSAPTLAELLVAEGFATGAFVSAYVLDARFGLAGGFETYDDRIARDSKPSAVNVWERHAPETLEPALEWWNAQQDRRRFLWLHLFEPHVPYAPPEPFNAEYADQPYRGEVAALDHFLGQLFATVRSADSAEKPLIVVTADHGESLGDHGEPAHGIFAYQPTIHVPMILWGPSIEPGVDDRLARHVDILPTVLEAVGLPEPGASATSSDPLPGHSLLQPPVADSISYFEALSATFDSGWAPLRGLVQGRLKVIDLPIPELYDLDADPGETQNLVDQRRRDFHRLRGLLPAESTWPPPRGELTDEAVARLRSLGYLSDDSTQVKASFGPEDDPKKWIHVEQLKQQYAEQAREGRAAEAVATAQEIVAEQPRMALAHTMLAEAQLLAGERTAALQTMKRAWQQDVASPGLTRRLASTLLRGGQPRAALEVLGRLLSGEAAGSAADGSDTAIDIESRSLYGQALRENGRPQEAENVLLAALAEDSRHAPTLERLSAVALDLGRPEAAADYARRALDLDDSLAQAWNNAGVARLMTGDIDGGLEAFERALERDPELWDTLYNLGFQAARAGRLALAQDALRRFVEGAPPARYAGDLPRARALLAQLEGQLNGQNPR